MRVESCGFETDSSDEGVEIVDDALIEAVELRSPLRFELGVCFDGAEKACRERCVDAFEELQNASRSITRYTGKKKLNVEGNSQERIRNLEQEGQG